ncbi:MAG: DUF3127 domain-containing protein [Chitinophagaceae bacterium]|nr:DUF3127 domain-containing protein [Chitinophagaceae bacterium]
MSYELTGKLVAKYDIVQRTETFKTREFAVEKTDEINGRTITNYVKFQCVQDKTAIIDRVNIGDEIKGLLQHQGQASGRRTARLITSPTSTPGASNRSYLGKGSTDNEYFEPLDTFSGTPDAVDDLPF